MRQICVLLLLVAACSSPSTTPRVDQNQMVGPAGGTVTSLDGNLTMEIPPGALPGDTMITIHKLDPIDYPPGLNRVEAAYEFLPEGVQFAAGVKVTVKSNQLPAVTPGEIRYVPEALAIISGGVVESVPDLFTHVSGPGNYAEVSGTISHFSTLALVRGVVALDGPLVEVEFAYPKTAVPGVAYDCFLIAGYLPDPENNKTVLIDNGDSGTNFEFPTNLVRAAGSIHPESPDTKYRETWVRTCTGDPVAHRVEWELRTPTSGTQKIAFDVTYRCETVQQTIERLDLSEFQILEAMFLGPPDFGISKTDKPLIVANLLGAVVVDLNTGEIVDGVGGSGATLAGVPLDRENIVLAGHNGSTLLVCDPVTGFFEPTDLTPFGDRCTDAGPYPAPPPLGSITQGYGPQECLGVVFVNHGANEIRFVTENAAQDGFELSPTEQITAAAFAGASGNVISACRDAGDGPVWFVTEGQPGELRVHADPSNAGLSSQLIGQTQDDPRWVRGNKDFLAVSNSGSNSLTIATRDAGGGFVIRGHFPVGSVPNGIDVAKLANGNFAVASTGYLDDGYWITIFTPGGGLVSNTRRATPVDCTRPGHIIFARDGTGDVFISCFDSSIVYRLPGLGP